MIDVTEQMIKDFKLTDDEVKLLRNSNLNDMYEMKSKGYLRPEIFDKILNVVDEIDQEGLYDIEQYRNMDQATHELTPEYIDSVATERQNMEVADSLNNEYANRLDSLEKKEGWIPDQVERDAVEWVKSLLEKFQGGLSEYDKSLLTEEELQELEFDKDDRLNNP